MKSSKIQKSKSMQKSSTNKKLNDNKNIKQNKKLIKNLIKNKKDNKSLNKKDNVDSKIKKCESNNNSLIKAIEEKNYQKVEESIKNSSLNINKLNNNGLSPLHISIIKGNYEIINLLLKNGAKPNILSSPKNQTPLHLAYMNYTNNTNNIIKLLLSHGANDNILDINNKKPSDYNINNINIKNNKNNKKINKTENNTNINNNNNNTNNITNTVTKKIKKGEKKDGYKGNVYNLKDSKDNSFVIITMDNISYLTSDENTINQINDNNNNNSNNIKINTTLNKNNFKDSLDEEDNNNNNNTSETKKIKYYTNNFFEKSKSDSLEDSLESPKNKKTKGKNQNIYENKYYTYYNIYHNYHNNINENNDINNYNDDIFKTLITNKRFSYFKLVKANSSLKNEKYLHCNSIKTNKNTCSSHYDNTDNSTYKINNNNINNYHSLENENENTNEKINKKSSIVQYSGNKNNIYNDFTYNNTFKTNRNSINSVGSTISQTNKKKNYKKAQSYTKENEIKNDFNQLNKNCSFLLNWLINIQLSSYYKNFLDNEIYDINKLIEQMKSPVNIFNYEDIENILSIHKPGHIFRILTQLEIDGGKIDKNVSNFMINKNRDISDNSAIGKKLLFSFSNNDNFNCNCCCNNIELDICEGKNGKIGKKNDLKSFLTRYNLIHLYQNFYHNGFDLINYVILQMYGSYPINDDILENYFHIYDEMQRNLLLKALESEINKINNFLNSINYYENENSSMAKYDKVIFEKDSYLGNVTEIKIDDKNNDCNIF